MTYNTRTAQQAKKNKEKKDRTVWVKDERNAGKPFPPDARMLARKAKAAERDNAHLAKMEAKSLARSIRMGMNATSDSKAEVVTVEPCKTLKQPAINLVMMLARKLEFQREVLEVQFY